MDVEVKFFTLDIAHGQKAYLCVLAEDDPYAYFSESTFRRPTFLYFLLESSCWNSQTGFLNRSVL